MIVLGVDPGTTLRAPTGWALVETDKDSVLSYGLLKPEGDNHVGSLASQLHALLSILATAHAIVWVAIESPWVGKNARTGLLLARLVGAFEGVCALLGISVRLVQPSEAKAALAHGGASKAEVQHAVTLRYGLVLPEHIADAIGIAYASLTWEER